MISFANAVIVKNGIVPIDLLHYQAEGVCLNWILEIGDIRRDDNSAPASNVTIDFYFQNRPVVGFGNIDKLKRQIIQRDRAPVFNNKSITVRNVAKANCIGNLNLMRLTYASRNIPKLVRKATVCKHSIDDLIPRKVREDVIRQHL